jgi:hypothetical protein
LTSLGDDRPEIQSGIDRDTNRERAKGEGYEDRQVLVASQGSPFDRAKTRSSFEAPFSFVILRVTFE